MNNLSAITILFTNETDMYSWTNLEQVDGLNECFNKFPDILHQRFDKKFTLKTARKKLLYVEKPCTNRDIANLIKKKHRLQGLFRNYPIKYGDEYLSYSNLVT